MQLGCVQYLKEVEAMIEHLFTSLDFLQFLRLLEKLHIEFGFHKILEDC